MIDVRGSGDAWVVLRDGVQVGALKWKMDQAYLAAEKLARAERLRTRPCLCCQTDFTSEGAHNRLCNDCRKTPCFGGTVGPSESEALGRSDGSKATVAFFDEISVV